MNKANRLINEKSPYLLQHAHNPVDWYPWGKEAFDKAVAENKPIFLSIGYSTCHWCHVMEKESFEDEEVAELMNDSFVSIKVDREERPDIDGIYMNVCQMMTGSGGWPLTIIMTPDQKPFFAGTYFPKESRFGRIGLMELIPKINEFWNLKKEEVYKSADEIFSAIKNSNSNKKREAINENILDKAFNIFLNRFDKQFGGFGNSPKFPAPHNLLFLLRYWKRRKDNRAVDMVEKTLQQMRLGGIYDHVGFGFHRYSTDREWLVPHFEKMLYDQALLISAYTEAFTATKENIYKSTAEEVINYILRDMTSPEGGFYSAEDADSEGEEGKFYLWKKEEITSVLGKDAKLFIKIFNLTDDGNWIDQSANKKDGTNILHLKKDLEELSREIKLSPEETSTILNSARTKLFDYREKRIHPFKDDKILTDWNGLMISALSKASQSFGKEEYLIAAEKAMKFILTNLLDDNKLLLHRFRQSEASLTGNVDDYAFIIAALLDLYEASFKIEYLKEAIRLNSEMIKHFWDDKNGSFFFTSDEGENLLVRQKEIYDGAVPSGNSVAMLNLLRISRITSDAGLEAKAFRIAEEFSSFLNSSPSSFTAAMCVLDFAFGPSYEIVIASDGGIDSEKQFLDAISKIYLPNKVVLLKLPDQKEIGSIASYTSGMESVENETTAYICQNYKCGMPVTSIEEFEKIIDKF